jgi:hypothetical protein
VSVKTVRCWECHEDVKVIHGRFTAHGNCPTWFVRLDMKDAWREGLESRFTDPRPDCKHPERWHSSDADSTEHEVTTLVAAFVGALRPDVVVETGSAWGQTAEAIGNVLAASGVGVLHTLEPDPERHAATVLRTKGLPVHVHQTPSLDWDDVPDDIGFAWLDSLHHLRVPEFRKFHPHFASRAIVGFHDAGPHQGALRSEILALENAGMLLPIFLPTPRGVCFAEVT